MNQNQAAKQVLDFYQNAFSNAFKANLLLQDQFERWANAVLDQTPWIAGEGREAVDKWAKLYKSARDNFKKYMDESYKEAEGLLMGQ